MPYGEIVNTSLKLLWKEKNLWFFSLAGLALGSLGSLIYTLFYAGAQGAILRNMGDWMTAPSGAPDEFVAQMMQFYGAMLGGGAIALCGALLGYIVNLIMRGAVISEAGKALVGESTDFGRGAREGANKAVSIFLIDLLWWLPAILVGLCVGGAFVAMFLNLIGGAAAGNMEDASAAMSALGGVFATMLAMMCVMLIYGIVLGIFAPLMYQALVLDEKSVGDAVRAGWNLAKANLGPMFVFLIIVVAARLALAILMQIIMAPFAGAWMMTWFQSFEDIGQGLPPSFNPMSAAMTGLMGVVGVALGLLVNSFMQSFSLTMYANVYRRLTADAAEAAGG